MLVGAHLWSLHLDAAGTAYYAGDEPHHLLAAQSIAEDRDLDVLNQYRARAWSAWRPEGLDPRGQLTNGRLHEPFSPGLPLIAAPAFAAGGPRAVELLLVLVTALGGALAYLLALRLVPDPWATAAALACGLSPPVFAASSAVYPEPVAATVLTAAALLAARMAERIRRGEVVLMFALLGTLPWLGFELVPAGLAIGWLAVRSLRRARRGLLALAGAEVALVGLAVAVAVNEALYGGPTPHSASADGTGADSAAEYGARTWRIAALLLDREIGVLRWAPVLALAVVGAWLLEARRREQLAAAIPGLREEQRVAGLCAVAIGAHVVAVAWLAPSLFELEPPARRLVPVLGLAVPLAAAGLRRLPRAGAALAGLTVAATVWLWVGVRLGEAGLAAERPPAPWGPLEAAFPRFGDSPGPYALAAVLLAAAAAFLVRARRASREGPGGAVGSAV